MNIVCVIFPANVNSLQIEVTLKEYYAKTIKHDTNEVVFDFGLVGWCGLFELSLIAVWIGNLLKRKKQVRVFYPNCNPTEIELRRQRPDLSLKRSLVCTFFNRWNFDLFLYENKIKIENYEDHPLSSSDNDLDSILPFKFFPDEKSFKDFESSINSESQYSILFRDDLSVGIIGSKGVRDTIIHEIGDNVYEHSDGSFGLFAIGKISPLLDPISAEMRINNASPLEKRFFETLEKSGYLQVVICDNGKGIFNTLKKGYQEEFGLDQSIKASNYETKVLEYAFRFNTSRNREEKLKNDKGQGRGLYWVKSLVRENSGLLTVRSGASIIVYDFLNYNELNKHVTNKEHSLLKSTVNLGGTQLKILFPLQLELIKQKKSYFQLGLPYEKQPRKRHNYRVLTVKSYLRDADEWTEEMTDLLVNDLLPKKSETDGLSISVIDFADTNWTKDELFPLLNELAQTQHDDRVTVIINAEGSAIFNIASEILKTKVEENPTRFRAIPLIRNSQIELIGLSEADQVFLAAHSERQLTNNYLEIFHRRNEHVYRLEREAGSLISRLDIDQIEAEVEKVYRKIITDKCFENVYDFDSPEKHKEVDDKAVFFRGKFLIPSNFYTDTYFRVTPLVSDKSIYNKMLYIFSRISQRLEEKPDCLLTTSNELKEFGSVLASNLSIISKRQIKHVHLTDAKDENSISAELIKLQKKSFVILSSVIGSGTTMSRLVDISESTFGINILGILSLIDARKSNESAGEGLVPQYIKHGSKKIPILSLFSYPITFYTSRPRGWRIEKIVRIDPTTNAPEKRIEPAENPFWGNAERNFLNVVVAKAKAIGIGHYVRRAKHYIYFFDMVRITRMFGIDISNRIKKDVDEFLRIPFGGIAPIGCVVFDPRSRGAQNIAQLIAKELNTITISFEDIKANQQNPQEKITDQSVVIYSSATSSGTHLKRIIDAVARFKPANILAYPIIHRRDPDDIDFLQRIDSYNGVNLRVRSFVALEIPAYHKLDCPVCGRIEELLSLTEFYHNENFSEAINQEINRIKEIKINEDAELENYEINELDEMIAKVVLRQKIGVGKTVFQTRKKEVTDLITNKTDTISANRLITVIAPEISVISTYKEIFYRDFRNALTKYCITILESDDLDFTNASSALILLRFLDSDLFIANIPLIFKSIGRERSLLNCLVLELLLLAKSSKTYHQQLIRSLNLCQISLQKEDIFHKIPVTDILQIQNLLLFLTSSLKSKMQQFEPNNIDERWLAFYNLWRNFVGEDERVHPQLAQGIFNITGITNVALFERALEMYIGEEGFSSLLDSLIINFEKIRYFLRRESARKLSYFLNEGDDTFFGDVKLLKERIQFLATLKFQGRLEDTLIKRYLRDDVTLEACQRLQNAFVNNNPVSQVLATKFTKLSPFLDNVFADWKVEFERRDIAFETKTINATVFAPIDILEDVLIGLLDNILVHAFTPSNRNKMAKVEVKQEYGEVKIFISDNGKGTTFEEIAKREDGGILHSQRLLSRYGGLLYLVETTDINEFSTQFLLKIKTKEEFFYETQNNSN